MKALERQQKFDAKSSDSRPKETPKISIGANGFSAGSADSNFVFQLHGLLQVDNHTFFNDGGIQGNDGFLLRKARPIFQGTVYRDFDFMFVPDFGGSSAVIQDAYLNYRFKPWLQLRAGKFKTPVGLEELQSDSATFFNERALPTTLLPNRDIGFQLWGNVADGRLSYAAGVFNGVGDGRSTGNSDFEDHREIAARVFLQPFQNFSNALDGLGFGLGGTWGKFSPNAGGLPGSYSTDGQEIYFSYTNGVVADGEHWRLSPQVCYYFGPLGILGEYAISDQRVIKGASSADLRNTAWQIAVGWTLTGEDASYKGIAPKHPFDPGANQWGAFQLVARYAELDVDDAAFPIYANPATFASDARAWAIGLNWYLNKNIRFNTSFSRTTFSGGGGPKATVTRRPEEILFTRLQLAF
ncbi:MAG TPA: porin [Verrucomicrobiae bacterium]|nr:porin [Verrucomicrobiae bacterium]